MTENTASTPSEPTTVEEVYGILLGRAPENRMEPRLAPLFRAMDVLGEPNKAFPIIHITGTNGKTSTARMIEAGLRAHGLRTGRYTSPHLSRVTERISIDGAPVSDEAFVRIWNEITPYLDIVDAELVAAGEPRLTYFECVTILGFAVFADQPVDVAVIEVGLGGITDATNVGDGAVSVVTPISLDHTDLLGDTVEDIAREKAGIIKPGGFLVSAAQPAGAAQILLDKAREVGVPYRFEGVEFGVESRALAVGGQIVTVRGLAGRYEDLAVPLHGAHQAENAAVAVAALEAFFGGGEKELSIDLLREGFEQVSSPGRLEVIRTSPTIIVDAAHNPDGIRVSARALTEAFDFSGLVVVLGVLREKDAEEILRTLQEEFSDLPVEYCFTQSASPRAIPADELAELALDLGYDEESIHVAEKLDDAIEYAVERADATGDFGGGVLITGSITVVGEARTLLGKDAA
ncbi:bifunctional folylpolyglutamate synthase/dihydrofolate synthase [Sinomonas sp. P10A9]|uniref:tetrahydrofolate synthase n=1 Tax=Sinomonas puerhi TaxID=3238584 RepID=A0AB39KY19_9MICC